MKKTAVKKTSKKVKTAAIKIDDLKGKNILIIGQPASGKTHLANLLAEANTHKVIHTDDYIEHGFKESLYVMLKDIKRTAGNTIIEGVNGYRLLRKGVELGCYYPDIVIELEVPEERMIETYINERPGKNLSSLRAFTRMHQTILNEYKAMENPRKPLWIKLQNNY